MSAVTCDGAQVSVGAEYSVGAAGGGAPFEVRVVLYEAARDQELVLPANLDRKHKTGHFK